MFAGQDRKEMMVLEGLFVSVDGRGLDSRLDLLLKGQLKALGKGKRRVVVSPDNLGGRGTNVSLL